MNQTLIALLIAVAPAVLLAQLPEYVPTQNLVGWYPFDGDAENFGGTSSNGTVYGATAAVNRFDDFNSALSFDGSNDYVEIPHSEDLLIGGGSATWACWCKIPSVSHGSQSPLITNYVTPTTPLFGLYVGGVNEGDYEGRVQIHYRTNSAGSEVGCQSDFRVDDSSWHHIAGVLDADQDSLQLYIDGILNATRYALAGSPDSYQSIVLGGNHLGRFFEVTIDDVGIWNRALHHDEIENLYESALANCIPAIELSDVSVFSTPTSRYAEDGVLAISVSTGQPASLSIVNLGDSTTEVIPFTTTVPEVGAGIYAVSVQDSDGCSSDTLTVILPYELCCECGVGDVDTDGICDDEDNCFDKRALNFSDAQNLDCVILGCTDPEYLEFDSSATDDDGSCISVCTAPTYYGYEYDVVRIGAQCWFAENLRTVQYSNGDSLQTGLGRSPVALDSPWYLVDEGACAYYGEGETCQAQSWGNCSGQCWSGEMDWDPCEDDSLTLNTYGRLYNFEAVLDPRNLCPLGWHVSTDSDWQLLEEHLGMPSNELFELGYRGTLNEVGVKLRADHSWWWYGTIPSDFIEGTDISGFSALPAGNRSYIGDYSSVSDQSSFYTASTAPDGRAIVRHMNSGKKGVWRGSFASNKMGCSIRCIKDQ